MIGFLFVASSSSSWSSLRRLSACPGVHRVLHRAEGARSDDRWQVANPTHRRTIRSAFDRQAVAADYIDSVRAADVEVSKEGNKIVAIADVEKKLHMVGNVSLCSSSRPARAPG